MEQCNRMTSRCPTAAVRSVLQPTEQVLDVEDIHLVVPVEIKELAVLLDRVCLVCVEQPLHVEDVVDDVFEVGEKAVNRVSGWRFAESTIVPSEAVLKFSCNRACPVDILVVAVQKATKEIWRLVNSCSPPLRGGEHVVLQEKLKLKMLEQRYCLGSRDIQEVVYRSYVLQGCAGVGHTSRTLLPRMWRFL
jgi:hypothetical protein